MSSTFRNVAGFLIALTFTALCGCGGDAYEDQFQKTLQQAMHPPAPPPAENKPAAAKKPAAKAKPAPPIEKPAAPAVEEQPANPPEQPQPGAKTDQPAPKADEAPAKSE